MAHMIRGTGTMTTKAPGRPQGSGMIVGAVVNKPQPPQQQQQQHHHSQQYGMSGPGAMAQQQGMPQYGQLAPGMLAVKSEPNGNQASQLQPGTNPPSQTQPLQQQPLQQQSQQQIQLTTQNLANTKEKTPMCLVNELARYNKIQHQYTLTDESGPAHSKTFYVKLKLGEEEYSANGPSIKKAQHAAAEIALSHTKQKKPPLKPPKNATSQGDLQSDSITPTVELNALAMKRGEPAMYRPIDMPRNTQYYPPQGMQQNLPYGGEQAMRNPRYHYPKYPRVFYVSLKVGQREFIGEGNTRQAARHNAAEKALKVVKLLPLPDNVIVNNDGSVKKSDAEIQATPGALESGAQINAEQGLKSEISLVHEIALKHNLSVNFEVTRESGPPHMRNFVTKCTCGDLVVEGEGNSKKLSKKRAAEKMLEKLQALPPLAPSQVKPKKGNQKKKNRNLVKIQKTVPEYGSGINPISRLIQIQQAKKEKEPVYTLVTERGLPRRREFVIQVAIGDHTCTGVGPNKKLAKRNAAEAMLQQMGYSRPSPQPGKPAIKAEGAGSTATSPADKKVTFIDQDTSHSRQLVPGVILMPTESSRHQMGGGVVGMPGHQQGGYMHHQGHPQHVGLGSVGDMGGHGHQASGMFNPQTTAAIAKELLDTGASPTAESLRKPNPAAGDTQGQVRPKQQLLYLADVLGFTVQFTDFPKGSNKSEYLSLVSLSTNPPQVSHGAGLTIEASHDMAALTALRALSEMGLDKIKQEPPSSRMGAGDGRMKSGKHGGKIHK